jgi:hypothetical protein
MQHSSAALVSELLSIHSELPSGTVSRLQLSLLLRSADRGELRASELDRAIDALRSERFHTLAVRVFSLGIR